MKDEELKVIINEAMDMVANKQPYCTFELRFLDYKGIVPELQQKWILPDGTEEWRAVPKVVKRDKN